MELVRNALLVCRPWDDDCAKHGVKAQCHICGDPVLVSYENAKNVIDFELRPICNQCFVIGNAIADRFGGFEMGGYLFGDVLSPDYFDPTKKPH